MYIAIAVRGSIETAMVARGEFGWSRRGSRSTSRKSTGLAGALLNAARKAAVLAVCPKEGYIGSAMGLVLTLSFRDEWLRAFFVEDARSRHIPTDIESRVFRKLQMIDDATTDQDLRVPPSNHFEKLRGNLAGFHSIR